MEANIEHPAAATVVVEVHAAAPETEEEAVLSCEKQPYPAHREVAQCVESDISAQRDNCSERKT